MNAIQRTRIRNLKSVSMLPGSWEKKFIQDMVKKLDIWERGYDKKKLTFSQHKTLAKMAYKFRRQMPTGSYPLQDPTYWNEEKFRYEMRNDVY